MSDLPDDSDDVEQPERHPVLPEAWRQVFALIELCADPRGFKKKLQGLHRAVTAVDEGMARLAADRTEHDAQLAKDRAELAAERDALMKRRVDVHQAEASLAERTERIRKLEVAWSGLGLPGEPPPLMGTLSRSKPFTGLQVAKYAAEHGRLPDHPDKPLDEPVVASEPPPAPLHRGHGDSGDWPANVTLTREPEAPAAGARIRGRKNPPPVTP